MRKRKRENKYLLAKVCISLFFLLLLFVCLKYYHQYQISKHEKKKIQDFFYEQVEIIESDEKEIKKNEKENSFNDSNYIAVIEIPKIAFRRGLVDKNSKDNNINKNVEIAKESTMPSEESSNLILMAHSGSGSIAYFNDIHKLDKKDYIYIYYNHVTYLYQVINKYEIEKKGYATFNSKDQTKRVTLITCKPNTNKQIVIIAELVIEEEY